MAKRLSTLFARRDLPAKARTLGMAVVPFLIGHNQVQRLTSEAERAIRDELLTQIQRSKANAKSSGHRFGSEIRAAADEALESLGVKKHPLEIYVDKLEEMDQVLSFATQAKLAEEIASIDLTHDTSEVGHELRFELANDVINILGNTETATVGDSPYRDGVTPKMIELGLKVIPALIGRDHVKRVGQFYASTRSRVTHFCESVMAQERPGSLIHESAIAAYESIGGIPIHDAASFVRAVTALAKFASGESSTIEMPVEIPTAEYSDSWWRYKLSMALRSNAPEKIIGEPTPADRARFAVELTPLLDHPNPEVRIFAARGLAELGAKKERRRPEIPPETILKLQEAATAEPKSEGARKAKEAAEEALRRMGYEARLIIRTALQFVRSVEELSTLEVQNTDRAKILREALGELNKEDIERILSGRMSREERRFAVRTLEALLDAKGIKAREWAVQGLGLLLGTQGTRAAVENWTLVHEIEDKLWALSRRREFENIHDRRVRSRAIEALRRMDNDVIEDPVQFVTHLETVAELWKAGQRSGERSAAEKAMDYFDLAMIHGQLESHLAAPVAGAYCDNRRRRKYSRGGPLKGHHRLWPFCASRETFRCWNSHGGIDEPESPRCRRTRRNLAFTQRYRGKGARANGGSRRTTLPTIQMEAFESRPETALDGIIGRLEGSDGTQRLEAARDLGRVVFDPSHSACVS